MLESRNSQKDNSDARMLHQLEMGDVSPVEDDLKNEQFAALNQTLVSWIRERMMPLSLAKEIALSQKNAARGVQDESPQQLMTVVVQRQELTGTPAEVLSQYLLESWISSHWERNSRAIAHLVTAVKELKLHMSDSVFVPVIAHALSELEERGEAMFNGGDPNLSIHDYLPKQIDYIKNRLINGAQAWQEVNKDHEHHFFYGAEYDQIDQIFDELQSMVSRIPQEVMLPKSQIVQMLELIERTITFNPHRDTGDPIKVFSLSLGTLKDQLNKLAGGVE